MENIQAHQHTIFFSSEKKDFFTDLLHKKDYSSVFILVDSNTEAHCLRIFWCLPLP